MRKFPGRLSIALALALACGSIPVEAQEGGASPTAEKGDERNRRLEEIRGRVIPADITTPSSMIAPPRGEYLIGPDDLLEVSVFEAPELNRTLRVTAGGEFTMPPLGMVKAAGLTPREVEFVLQELLRRSYLKDPHVGVFVREMNSHPVSVFGAVRLPGVYQISGRRTLVEVLSMAGGLAPDAGDAVIVMRGRAGPAALVPVAAASPGEIPKEEMVLESRMENLDPEGEGLVVNLKHLLESGDPRSNLFVYPGDVVKVARAGIVYVVGEVKKDGGFLLKTNENISVLQAIALAEGLTATAAKSRALIIRSREGGVREEIPVDLGKLLKGKIDDPYLEANDILFVPNNTGKAVFLRGLQEAVRTITGVIIFSSR